MITAVILNYFKPSRSQCVRALVRANSKLAPPANVAVTETRGWIADLDFGEHAPDVAIICHKAWGLL